MCNEIFNILIPGEFWDGFAHNKGVERSSSVIAFQTDSFSLSISLSVTIQILSKKMYMLRSGCLFSIDRWANLALFKNQKSFAIWSWIMQACLLFLNLCCVIWWTLISCRLSWVRCLLFIFYSVLKFTFPTVGWEAFFKQRNNEGKKITSS